MADDDERGFAQGLATGIAIAAVAVHLLLAVAASDLAAMYRDLGHPELPPLTRLAAGAFRFMLKLAK